jgi:hypothetical protein
MWECKLNSSGSKRPSDGLLSGKIGGEDISDSAETVSASQEGFCSMNLVINSSSPIFNLPLLKTAAGASVNVCRGPCFSLLCRNLISRLEPEVGHLKSITFHGFVYV